MTDNMKITYEELMTEFEKCKRTVYHFTPEQEKALIEAREKYNVTWEKIALIFSEKLNYKFNHRTLYDIYKKIKRNKSNV